MKAITAIKVMLILVGMVTLFHLSILFKIIPYDITWGGRLQNDTEMYVFESISIAINLVLAVVLLIKGTYVKAILSPKVVNGILWVFFALFALNTVGNFVAETNFEKSFSLLTLGSAVLIWIILRAKK